MKIRIKFLSVIFAAAIAVSFAVSLTACKTQPKYELSYARGIYNAVGEMPAAKSYKEGQEVTLAPSTTFTFSGYTFAGWSDGTETYEGGATFVMPAHDVKLMAKWVKGDPNAPVVTASSVGFEGDYFVFKGTAKNVNKLYVILNNTNVAASNQNFVEAEIEGGAFTARMPLSTLEGYNKNNTPFNLRYKTDSLDGEIKGVAQGNLSLSQTYIHGDYKFRLAVNSGTSCVAVYYDPAPVVNPPVVEPEPTVTVSAISVAFDEENFVVTGTVENVQKLNIYLINTNVSGSGNNFVEAEIADGAFTARLSLDKLIEFNVGSNIPFNLRYTANGGTEPINIEQGSLDITATHTYGGKDFRIGLNGKCVAVYYSATPVVNPDPEPGDPDYTFSVADMRFSGGKFIIEGDCGEDVEKLVFHLHNTGSPVIDFTSAAVIESGKFKAEFVLSEIKRVDGSEPPASYINVRYERNDDGYQSLNLLPTTNGNYIVGQEYRYGEKTWTLKADSTRTYLNWSDVTDKYRITEVSLELVEGKPTLKIAGTTTDAIAAADLKLLLDKNKGTTKQKYIENSATEAGKFSFNIDLSDLIASENKSAASDQQAYFIRLYNGSTKIADVNSRWASDLLWERGQIETDNAVYFLMKNTEWSNTAWNTLGICKFDK